MGRFASVGRQFQNCSALRIRARNGLMHRSNSRLYSITSPTLRDAIASMPLGISDS